VLGDLAVLDPEQVIEGRGFAVELAFAGDEDEVAFSEHAMNAVNFCHDASFGPRFERRGQIRHAVGDLGMVLDVPITVAVTGERVHLPVDENISDEALNQRLVGLGLVKVAGLNRAIDHAATARVLREPPGEADKRLASTLTQMIWAAIYLDDPGFGQR
jgi:hypothetical protein